MSARRASQAGYTLVELMMALALFVFGVLGIVSMQKLVMVSTTNARQVALAQRIAQTWATQLQLDSLAWRTDLTGATWLGEVDSGSWIRPAPVADRVSPAFDALGNPLADAQLARVAFCANVRLTTLYPSNTPVQGNGLMRAEIRVFWLRDGESALTNGGLCPAAISASEMTDIGKATDRYNFVYATTGVRQHSAI